MSFAGDDSRADVSSTFLQPFLAKAIGQGRTLTVNLESSFDWENSQWTVPANLTYSKVTRVGDQFKRKNGALFRSSDDRRARAGQNGKRTT